MIYAWNTNAIVKVISALTFITALAAVGLSSPDALKALWSWKAAMLTGPSVAVFLLTLRPVFRCVYRVTFARLWLFPDLDGEWEGEIHSNWPRIETMMQAARGERAPFNVLSDPVPSDAEKPPVSVIAKIESGLLDYKIKMTISETRKSRTIFVKPEWRRPDPPRLNYIFLQDEEGAVAVSDTDEHRGAAYLDYDVETGRLNGIYWTERQRELGLNTAGRLRLRRKNKGKAI